MHVMSHNRPPVTAIRHPLLDSIQTPVDTANRSIEKGLQSTRTFVPYDEIIHVAETSGKGTARRPGRREPGR
jgi:hypothetical protein